MKIKIAIIIVIVIAIVAWLIFNGDTESNFQSHIDYSRQLAINTHGGEDPLEGGSSGERSIIASYTNKRFDKILSFVEEPWASGTGGTAGNVIISNVDGSEIREIDWFLTEPNMVAKSFQSSPDDRYVIYSTLSATGACFTGGSTFVDFQEDAIVALEAPYEYKFEPGDLDIGDGGKPSWIDSNTIEVIEPQAYCLEELGQKPVFETWQYNIETGKYQKVE
ncbi:MAG: hypothetical protein ABH833_01560 [Parcubacteria group bacterium]